MRGTEAYTRPTLFLIIATVVLAGLPVGVSASPGLGEVYPNPYAEGDAGEYVGVDTDGTNLTDWKVTDGEDTVRLPERSYAGRVYLGGEKPKTVGGLGLELANSGDEVRLVNPEGEAVDEVVYGEDDSLDPNEGEILVKEDRDWEIRTLGATDFEYSDFDADSVTGFVAPDSSAEAVSRAIESADERLLVSGYEFDSEYIARLLTEAEEKGVEVEVLVEGSPAGGFEADDSEVLGSMASEGVEVDVVEGERRRYRFVHAKYIVVDSESAVVTSENWVSHSVSPEAAGPRGWGVVVESEGVAGRLEDVFRNDTDEGWYSVRNWSESSPSRIEGGSEEESESEYETRGTGFGTQTFEEAEVGVVLSPDSSVEPVVEMIDSADETVYVQQAYIRDPETNPYLNQVVEEAREGTQVRVLLDGRWFAREENQAIADRLNSIGEEEGVDIEARVSETAVHNKGVVVDGEEVLVSSINWNLNSINNNREVGVVVDDNETASYFERVFKSDWKTSKRANPSGTVLGLVRPNIVEILLILITAGISVWLGLKYVYDYD
ncbi:MAG: phospholipase D-like domain-containing protein [Halobacteria archaeon]|nr:phospholipase D-like domain-containing protein [Halobacteria archaeon]